MYYITEENKDLQREKIEKRIDKLFETITNTFFIPLNKGKFMKRIKTFLKIKLFNFSKVDETLKEIKINLFTEKKFGFIRSLEIEARAGRVWIADRPDVFFRIYHVCFQYKIRLDMRLIRELDKIVINKYSCQNFYDNHEIIARINVLGDIDIEDQE